MEISESCVKVVVCSGPEKFDTLLHGSPNTDVNVHHIPDYEKHSDFLQKVLNIMITNSAHLKQSLYSFDKHAIIKIGDWNKPYTQRRSKMNVWTRIYAFILCVFSSASLLAGAILAIPQSPLAAVVLFGLCVMMSILICAYLFYEHNLHGRSQNDER